MSFLESQLVSIKNNIQNLLIFFIKYKGQLIIKKLSTA